MARTIFQALSQFFGKSGDADKALPRFLVDLGLVLVGLNIASPDSWDWWLHRKSPVTSRIRGNLFTPVTAAVWAPIFV